MSKDKKTYIPYQTYLTEDEMPKQWYNIRSEFKDIEPYLTPDNKVVKVEDLFPIFPEALARQELSMEKYIDIPEEIMDIYKTYRATPLHRAYNLEKYLETPARIYYKYEGANQSGSHKLNTAIAQVYYNKMDGTKKLTTETGAGQWGTALSVACNMFDIDCQVFMVRVSAEQKKERANLIKTFGATLTQSPSNTTKSGREFLKDERNKNGALGHAISEAIEVAVTSENTRYALGSVLNHVCLHQTIIGQECIKQLDKIGEKADIVIACCGGGSNFAGLSFPFINKKINEKEDIEIIGVEPASCPTMTKGKYAYDYGDTAHLTPKMLQYTLGNSFVPLPIHAGGLRYHGMGSLVSRVVHDKLAKAVSVTQSEVFDAGLIFAKTEGILPAPESAHAIAQTVKEALKCKQENKEKVIVFNLTGNGQFDTGSYASYIAGNVKDLELDKDYLQVGFNSIPE